MRSAASFYKINVDDIRPTDKLKISTKYLRHSTNLLVNIDLSAEASMPANTTLKTKIFVPIQSSIFASSMSMKLIDSSAEDLKLI